MSVDSVVKPKLLTLCGYRILPATDGGKKGIYLFEKYLAAHFELIMIATKDNSPDEALTFTLKKMLGKNSLRYVNPILLFQLYRIIKTEKINYFLIEHCYFGWVGVLLKWIAGVKLIVHHHNIEATRFKSLNKWWWRILWQYEKIVSKQADENFYKTNEDKLFAIAAFGLNPIHTMTVPFGTPISSSPTLEQKNECTSTISTMHGIAPDTLLFMFAASYNYPPNLQALKIILEEINPILCNLQKQYKIIICGGGLPKEMLNLYEYQSKHVIYAGFVDDIDVYFKGCHIFLNPVLEGGGIKTKLVEALACGQSAVSSKIGAMGVTIDLSAPKLVIAMQDDAAAYLHAINELLPSISAPTRDVFFEYFSWKQIAKKVYTKIMN